MSRPQWPRARDLLGAVAATGAMATALGPLRSHAPGAALLFVEGAIGAAIYGATAWALDVARLRSRLKALIGPRRLHPATRSPKIS
jgi:hypothetical protein